MCITTWAFKACASVPALEHLPPSATWTILRYCVKHLNYLAQVTEFSLVQDSLRAWELPPKPPDPLTHLTTLTLRSLPTELGGLGIRRYSGLAGELACLRGRTVFCEFAERFNELLAGAMEDHWSPIMLGAVENELGRRSRVCSELTTMWKRIRNIPCPHPMSRVCSGLLPGDRRILSPIRLHQSGPLRYGAAE